MKRILTSAQIRNCDSYTISQGIPSLTLMENAGGLCTAEIIKRLNNPEPGSIVFVVFCGPGNNGGDGYVIARLLAEKGFEIELVPVGGISFTNDCKLNRDKCVERSLPFSEIDDCGVYDLPVCIIDSIFGSGINRPVADDYLRAVRRINSMKGAYVFSIDMPSGMYSEHEMPISAEAVACNTLLKIHAPVLNLMLPQYQCFFNEIKILDIGLMEPPDLITGNDIQYFLISGELISGLIKPRPKAAHKGVFGHACIVAGGKGKIGAAILSANACLRSGVGLLSVYAPKTAANVIHTALPEAMLLDSDDDECISGKPIIEGYSAIGFGPGCGTEKATQGFLKQLIQDSLTPLVIDADGINILSENKTWLAFLKPNTILTPHPGEFFRLSGVKEPGITQIQKASEMAQRYSIIIILKGTRTATCLPDSRVFFNPTGNPGMAKGGSGDALTGLITGLLAQGYKPADASIIAVYLHGLAGDIAAQKFTEHGMITSDLIAQIPKAFAMLQKGI